MFEQESYKQPPSAPELQEGDLFNNYEIKTWELGPRIYKIIGVSVIANILIFATFAQTNLLTMRGCDSPFVGNVCTVLDMAYVGTVLFGTEREVADLAYERTQLGDADDVTFISMDGVEPQFEYPEGYFKLANPEQFVTDPIATYDPNNTGFATGIPNYSPNPTIGNDLASRPQKLPKKVKDAVVGEVKNPWGDDTETEDDGTKTGKEPGDGIVADKGGKPEPSPTPSNPVDEAQPDRNGVVLNKAPTREKADETLKRISNGSIDLTRSFKASVAGDLGLGKDGKTIILKNPKPVPTDPSVPNDAALEKLAQEWIVSVGDAGWFGYLHLFKARTVTVTVEQVGEKFIATVKASQPSENEAKLAASGMNGYLAFGKATADGDELVFLNAAKTAADGKTLVLKVEMDKPVVQEMIQRKLAEIKSKEVKPNSNAGFRPANSTAAK